MKPFNLEEYLKTPSKKVVTKEGKTVKRILCTDARGNYPVVALIEEGCYDNAISYTKDGKLYAGETNDYDIFFAPEKHEGWVNVYNGGADYRHTGDVFSSKERALMVAEGYDCVATVKIEWEE